MPPQSQEWNIRPRANACHTSERPFEDGESFMSRLFQGEDEGFAREDFAMDAWDEALRDGALSVWQSTFRVPPPPEEEALKSETAEETLRKLMEGSNPEDAGAIFILAMQLERKRQLVPRARKRRPDGSLLLIYEHKQTGETFLVPDPEWSLEEIATVQQEVAIRLGWIEPEKDPEDEEASNDDSDTEDVEANTEEEAESDSGSEEDSSDESEEAEAEEDAEDQEEEAVELDASEGEEE